ncbi:hypothetical protein ABEB36_000811 [Hypothenemus hampei]|uniref:NADH dehydrogenase [ubiquinone] 1 alpha subcomplex subunit 6 n=1 Tax=Hypothenemus hampei TaxID=57062 RepID=A0ABD1FCH6_HYPHA
MASETSKKIYRSVRPILSLDHYEARRRVIGLYKAWYRQIPYIVKYYDIEFNEKQCKDKLREEFTKYDKISDIRVIDMLVIKEMAEFWITKRGVCLFFENDKHQKKHDSFLAKFINNED